MRRTSAADIGDKLLKALSVPIYEAAGADTEVKGGVATDSEAGYHAKSGSTVAQDGTVAAKCSSGS